MGAPMGNKNAAGSHKNKGRAKLMKTFAHPKRKAIKGRAPKTRFSRGWKPDPTW